MIHPALRQHLAYALAGSSAYWAATANRGISYFDSIMLVHTSGTPVYNGFADMKWPCYGTWFCNPGVAQGSYRWIEFGGTLGTVLTSNVFVSYAWHIGTLDGGGEDGMPYPLAYNSWFPVRINNPGTENVYVHCRVEVKDYGSVIPPESGGQLLWCEWSGNSPTFGDDGAGAWSCGSLYMIVSGGTDIGARGSAVSRTIPSGGTCATIVMKSLLSASIYNPGTIEFGYEDIFGYFDHALFRLTPLHDTVSQQFDHMEIGDLILATFKIHILTGSSNNTEGLVGTILTD